MRMTFWICFKKVGRKGGNVQCSLIVTRRRELVTQNGGYLRSGFPLHSAQGRHLGRNVHTYDKEGVRGVGGRNPRKKHFFLDMRRPFAFCLRRRHRFSPSVRTAKRWGCTKMRQEGTQKKETWRQGGAGDGPHLLGRKGSKLRFLRSSLRYCDGTSSCSNSVNLRSRIVSIKA